MRIRPETPTDRPAALAVTEAAFASRASGGRTVEAVLLERLWESPAYLPALSLVAEDDDGAICGYVITTRAHIGQVPSLGLGPIGVLPERQGQGIGRLLLEESIARATALDEPCLVLLGSPLIYGRFGFVRADERGVLPPEPAWGADFMVRALTGAPLPTGNFRYAPPFDAL
ncbi:GNAT family N-acetyltransferase [Arthrobacter tumbae]|uniref:GNAT family N-acetyltransferase n=1 Tax=Arthrobacter tumbae TaxID=163874 RepID=UPI0019560D5A|nr:N-acetyltransferase [Arthrobacter tumbae]MBM7782454.1 putative N-acetyltransferase YhbS [Arthrobacter tumbae]